MATRKREILKCRRPNWPEGKTAYMERWEGDEETEDIIKASPLGGGFVYSIPKTDIVERNCAVEDEWEWIWVGFDEHPICKAWVHKHHNWNGWKEPLIPRTEVEAFVKAWNAEDIEDPDEFDNTMTLVDDGEAIMFPTFCQDDGEERHYRLEPYTVDSIPYRYGETEKDINFYNVGSGMCWVAWEAEDFKADTMENLGFKVGTRVRFSDSVERYPHALIKKGEYGTVKNLDTHTLDVRPDRDQGSALAEWDGCIVWYGEENPGCCHSHDFCDANMTMDAAWRNVFLTEPDVGKKWTTDLWNEAWGIAKANGFPTTHECYPNPAECPVCHGDGTGSLDRWGCAPRACTCDGDRSNPEWMHAHDCPVEAAARKGFEAKPFLHSGEMPHPAGPNVEPIASAVHQLRLIEIELGGWIEREDVQQLEPPDLHREMLDRRMAVREALKAVTP